MTAHRGLALLAALAIPSETLAQDSTRALAEDIPPAGYGTLHQDDLSLRLRGENIQIQLLPLDERVIRLLSPDSYRALRSLKDLKAAQINEAATSYGIANPTLFVVQFFGLRERARFVPEDVTITSRGRFFRPLRIIPLTIRWGEHQLAQRERAVAVYVFEPDIEVLEPFVATYESSRAGDWDRILRRLDEERAAVIARAAAAGKN